jgi:formylglycine-generating enzyme required for sulfatase activity
MDATQCGPGDGARVVRGGSWHHQPQWLRSACRYGHAPDTRYFDIGLRLALNL